MSARSMSTAVLFLAVGLAVTIAAGPDEKPKAADLKAQAGRLVSQLGDVDPAKQEAAATALLKLGPDVLPFLPATDEGLTPAQVQRLQTVRTTLRDARAQKELAPRLVTLRDDAIPLGKALAELARQTGNRVEDRRREKGEEPKLRLDLKAVPFWQALDAIAKEADLRVTMQGREGGVSLMDGPHQAVPVSYSGVFRTGVKRVTALRDLDADAHLCVVQLEVAWEPRFQPLFLETKADATTVRDDKGNARKVAEGAGGRAPVFGRSAAEVEIRVEAPKRSVERLATVAGTLAVISPSKMLTFTFDQLAKGEAKQEGVSVQVSQLKTEPELWTVGITLEYPPETPEFESFESWLVNNAIFLQKKTGGKRHPANGGYEIDDQAGHKAILTYRFVEDEELTLGKPEDWKLIYRTPGTIVRMPVQFEFKDVALP